MAASALAAGYLPYCDSPSSSEEEEDADGAERPSILSAVSTAGFSLGPQPCQPPGRQQVVVHAAGGRAAAPGGPVDLPAELLGAIADFLSDADVVAFLLV
eukprot:COSAG04_NODE_19826_length_407_cov_0.840909_1_plen_99_part_10